MGRYNYTKALHKLVDFAHEQGFTNVDLNHKESLMSWDPKTLNYPRAIKLDGSYNNEIKVYLFLHELGHFELRKDWELFGYFLPDVCEAETIKFMYGDKNITKRNLYTVSMIEEEYKAWDEGYKLGLRLDIRINKDNWNWIKTKCLMSYIRHYGKKK
jgi:hypothetical protein